MAKLNFLQPLDLSFALHKPSEIIVICWFDAHITFINIHFYNYNVQNVESQNISVETVMHYFHN